MGAFKSKEQNGMFVEPPQLPPGCWAFQQGLRLLVDCNCHKTAPRRCNPGPPPIPDSMAEWMGMPAPPRRQLRPEELIWQEYFDHVPNPYPLLDEGTLEKRILWPELYRIHTNEPHNLTEIELAALAPDLGSEVLSGQAESTNPTSYSHWGPVPFNGLAYPIEALMPDEMAHRSFVRTTQYNRELEEFLFTGDDVDHAVWHSNKLLAFKPELTIYRLWTDNYTYVADWDPRVVLNILAGSILDQINRPHHEDRLGMVFKLMPARHTYALQYCAMNTAERVADEIEQALAGIRTEKDLGRMAFRFAPWLAYLFEMYQLWKDITGLDIAREQAKVNITARSENTNDPDPSRTEASKDAFKWEQWSDEHKKIGKGHKYPSFWLPWYRSPYRPKVVAEQYGPESEPQPWEVLLTAEPQPNDVPWDTICGDVLAASKRWRSINRRKEEFMPRFDAVLKAWDIMGPKLRKLGHGERLDKISKIVSWRRKGKSPEFLRHEQPWMCKFVEPFDLCITVGHAMHMLTLAIRQQIEPVYWEI